MDNKKYPEHMAIIAVQQMNLAFERGNYETVLTAYKNIKRHSIVTKQLDKYPKLKQWLDTNI